MERYQQNNSLADGRLAAPKPNASRAGSRRFSLAKVGPGYRKLGQASWAGLSPGAKQLRRRARSELLIKSQIGQTHTAVQL